MVQPSQQEAQQLHKMLENCSHFDKDVRHTGALDLCHAILSRPTPFEEAIEKRFCSCFIKHLEDENVEVKSNAVKCIKDTASRIRDTNLITILEKLAQEIVEGKQETLDIFTLALRGIVTEAREEFAGSLIASVNPKLVVGLEKGRNEVKSECLEIYTDIFKRFGGYLLRQHSIVDKNRLMNGINNLLGDEIEINLRKRASQCMGTFAVVLNGQQLQQLTVFLLNRIDKSTTKVDQLT
jgi:hypothetical protein